MGKTSLEYAAKMRKRRKELEAAGTYVNPRFKTESRVHAYWRRTQHIDGFGSEPLYISWLVRQLANCEPPEEKQA